MCPPPPGVTAPLPKVMQPATSMPHVFWKLPHNHMGWSQTSENSLKQPYKVAPGWVSQI